MVSKVLKKYPSGASDVPSVEPSPDAIPQTPSRAQISGVIRSLTPALSACVEEGFKGPLNLSFTIAGNTGEVMEGEALGPISETPAGECVSEALMAAKFPLFRKDVLRIKYPVKI